MPLPLGYKGVVPTEGVEPPIPLGPQGLSLLRIPFRQVGTEPRWLASEAHGVLIIGGEGGNRTLAA